MRRVSRREFLVGAAVGTAALGVSRAAVFGADLKGSGLVVVYDGGGAWGAAQKAAYFDPFEAATSIKVVPSPAAPATRIRAGAKVGAPGFDVAEMSAARIDTFVREGLLVPIDFQWFDPADKAAFAPLPPTEYSVPSFYYSVVLAYDPAKYPSEPPKVWTDFWDTKRFPGQRALAPGSWGPSGATFELATLGDGAAPTQVYPIDWDRAFRSLDRIRPSLLKFWQSGAESVQLIVDGQIAMGSTWNGRVTDLQAKGVRIAMSWDQAVMEATNLVVPRGAKNVENAMKFIAFASQPKNQARFAELIAYGPTNTRAYEHISAARAAILPTASALRGRQIVQDNAWWNREVTPGKTNESMAPDHWTQWITRSR